MEDASNHDLYEKHFDQARKDIVKIDRNAYGEKKRVIKRLAEDLAIEGMPLHTICSETVKRLHDIVSPRHVRNWLDSKYKDSKQSSNAKKQAGKAKERTQQTANLVAHVPPQVKHAEPQEIVVSVENSRRPSQDHLPSPMNRVPVGTAMPDLNSSARISHGEERKDTARETRFVVPKSRMLAIIDNLKLARKRVYLYFDENGELLRVEPDRQRSSRMMRGQRLERDVSPNAWAALIHAGKLARK